MVEYKDAFQLGEADFILVTHRVGKHNMEQFLATRKMHDGARFSCAHQALEAMTFLHSCDIVHLDVKPANFVYSEHRLRFVLIDFDSALPSGQGLGPELAVGKFTPAYVAPEVARAAKGAGTWAACQADEKIDSWSPLFVFQLLRLI